MKNLLSILTLAIVFMAGNLFAQDSLVIQEKNQNQHQWQHQNKTNTATQVKGHYGVGFVDLNGDGYNDNAPDADGDGIPNGLDEDYEGSMTRAGNGVGGFIDEDGDGINDNAMDADGDGIPNGQDDDYVRPEDGSGQMHRYGEGKAMNGVGTGVGTGDCDGTSDQGTKKRGGRNQANFHHDPQQKSALTRAGFFFAPFE